MLLHIIKICDSVRTNLRKRILNSEFSICWLTDIMSCHQSQTNKLREIIRFRNNKIVLIALECVIFQSQTLNSLYNDLSLFNRK